MYKLIRSTLCVAALLGLSTSGAFAAQVLAPDTDEGDLVPTGKGWGERAYPTPHYNPNANSSAGRKTTGNGIDYHGGPVMLGTTNVYYIWYGNWANNTATTILTDLAKNIGGSAYYNINTTYYDAAQRHVSNSVAYQTAINDSYSKGAALTDANIQTIVTSAINSHALPLDTNGVYFVLTSADVNETSGFCTQYCGWHTHANIAGLGDIKYSFVGNPDRCPSACAAQTTSPNGNAGADGMASIISHELEEAVSDPDLNAWYDRRGAENADKCAWTFGTTYSAGDGSANMKIGSRDFLIQQNWVNASGGYCAKSF